MHPSPPSHVRPPAVAGSFYPARTDLLRDTVGKLLARADPPLVEGALRALIVPHAGYVYSGAVAATAYAALSRDGLARSVAILGPSHFVRLVGIAVSGATDWQTPLGLVPVDDELRERTVQAGGAVDDRFHAVDHALEVQLPFLQRCWNAAFRILPVAVGAESATATAALIGALVPDALVVVSTDLSHYHDAASARRLDRATAEAVVALDAQAIGDGDACGADALRGLLVHARLAGWTCTLLDLRTSADTAGDSDRVVGYGAFAFSSEPEEAGA